MTAIPKCAFLIKKGAPRIVESLSPWTSRKALMTDVFEAWEGPLPHGRDYYVRRGEAPPTGLRPVGAVNEPPEPLPEQDLFDAFDQLDDEDFTTGNMPRVEALTRILDRPVSSEERDAAWGKFIASKE